MHSVHCTLDKSVQGTDYSLYNEQWRHDPPVAKHCPQPGQEQLEQLLLLGGSRPLHSEVYPTSSSVNLVLKTFQQGLMIIFTEPNNCIDRLFCTSMYEAPASFMANSCTLSPAHTGWVCPSTSPGGNNLT